MIFVNIYITEVMLSKEMQTDMVLVTFLIRFFACNPGYLW